MHENDIASYTTVEGNTIYDLETGGMVAYGSPIRMVTMTKYADGTEEMMIDTESVTEAAMNAKLDAPNGNITDTEKVDVLEYELNAMYGGNFCIKPDFPLCRPLSGSVYGYSGSSAEHCGN